jgi:hypothetical protein
MKHAQFRKESEELESKVITRIMLTLSLTLILSTVLITPTAAAYPFEDIFEKDLLDIANSNPKIESIYIKNWLDTRPSGHLWAFIRINYTAGLSDHEKISVQDYVQRQLESKWYIDIVERNYIYVYYGYPSPPVPWPGYVIGDLNVAFKTASIDPLLTLTITVNRIKKGLTETNLLELVDDDNDGFITQDIDKHMLNLIKRTHKITTFDFPGEYTATKGAWKVTLQSTDDFTITLT